MRLLWQIITQVVLAAIAFVVTSLVLPGFTLHWGGFLIGLGVFALANIVLGPFVLNIAQRYAAPLAGGVGLVSTLLALWIASLFEGGIELRGVDTWILAPIIIWVITALGGWIIMSLIIDRILKRRAAERALRSVQA